MLDLAVLLSYDPNNPNHDILNFISIIDDGTNTKLSIDANGNGNGFTDVSIMLLQVTGVSLSDMEHDGNIVLF